MTQLFINPFPVNSAECFSQGELDRLFSPWRVFCSCSSKALHGTQKPQSVPTGQSAGHLHKRRSVLFDTTRSDTFSMIHPVRTQTLARDGCLGPLQCLFGQLPGGTRHVCSRSCGQHVWDAGRSAHGAVKPNNSRPQLSATLTQFAWTTRALLHLWDPEPGWRQKVWKKLLSNNKLLKAPIWQT